MSVDDAKVAEVFERGGKRQKEIAGALFPILADVLQIGEEQGLGFGNPLVVRKSAGNYEFSIRVRVID